MTREQTSAMREQEIRRRLTAQWDGDMLQRFFDASEVQFLLDELSAVRAENEKLTKSLDVSKKVCAYQVQFGTEMSALAHRLEAGLLAVLRTEFHEDIFFAHEDAVSAAKKAIDGPYTKHHATTPEKASVPTPAVRGDREGDSNNG